MYKIDYHGDDYAISLNNSKRFIELVNSGKLDSFSIIANMGCYEECMTLLKDNWSTFVKKPLISVHINLIDGISLSERKNPLLVDENGLLRCSWGKLFISGLIPGKRRDSLKKDLILEVKSQIKRVYEDLPEGAELRLDSHVHTHMIPIVFDAIMASLKESGLKEQVKYIRVSKEPLSPFLFTKEVLGTYPLVNVIKNIILNFLSFRVKRILKKNNIEGGLLWGLVLSGKMDKDRIDLLSSKMLKIAKKKDLCLEILCHPGIVLLEEKRPEYGDDDLIAFFSENRNVEYEAVIKRAGF